MTRPASTLSPAARDRVTEYAWDLRRNRVSAAGIERREALIFALCSAATWDAYLDATGQWEAESRVAD